MFAKLTETSNASSQWLVMFEKETGRLVVITEDLSIANQIEGSHLLGIVIDEKPEAVTQANAAAWCYSETKFTPYEVNQRPANTIPLPEYNKQALEKLLLDKIDALRKTSLNASSVDSATRKLWESERKLFESGILSSSSLPLHLNKAASQNKTIAELIEVENGEKTRKKALFILTEKTRENFLHEIHQADAKQLYSLRERILGEIPSITVTLENQHEFPKCSLQDEDAQLRIEIERLRIALKQKSNQIRLPYVSGFQGNDIAQKTLLLAARNYQAIGIASHHLDIKTLIAYAASRSLSITDAAAQIIDGHQELLSMLFDTEQLKDSVFIQIEQVAFKNQLVDLANDIAKYQFVVKKITTSAPAKPKHKQIDQKDISAEQIRYLTSNSKEQYAGAATIHRFDSLSSAEFLVAAQSGHPFFITSLVKDWPIYALGFNWFKENFGHIPVKARVNDYVADAFSKRREYVDLDLQGYMTLIEKKESELMSLPPYLGNQVIPEISALCNWPDFFEDWAATKAWIGPVGTITPLHCDYNDNLFAQVSGSKSFFLYPPHVAACLRLKEVNPVLFASEFDPQTPDFVAYPKMKDVKPIECTVKEGDLLYLPAGWFHHVTAQSFSFSINRWSRDLPNALKDDKAVPKPKSQVLNIRVQTWKK